MSYSRREFLKQGLGGLTGLSLLGLAGCSNPNTTTAPMEPDSGTLHMVFWGSTTRDQLTKTTFSEFHKENPSYSISAPAKPDAFNVYFQDLDKLIAAGQTPDLIQMDMRYIAQYVRRRQLMDLTEVIYNQTLDLSDFDPLLLSSSKVNNTIYGVPLGGNYQAGIYNQDYLDKAGIPLQKDLTWDTFTVYAAELTRALGGGIYGTQDLSNDITSFELFVRQRGKEMYTRDGQVNFTQEDAGDWFNYWSKMRNANACLPYSLQKDLDVTGTAKDNSVVQGKAVFMFTLSNLLESYQKAAPQRRLGITTPIAGGPGSSPGMYLKTSMALSIAANTQYPKTAVNYLNFILNQADAIRTLGIERGIPGSAKTVNLLRPNLTAVQKFMADYVASVPNTGLSSVKTVLDPPGASKVQTLIQNTANDIAAGKLQVSAGAQIFYTGAKKVAPTG